MVVVVVGSRGWRRGAPRPGHVGYNKKFDFFFFIAPSRAIGSVETPRPTSVS